MKTTIPCRRPRVRTTTTTQHSEVQRWKATCEVPGCGWSYSNIAKTDVQVHTSWHKGDHRGAVPATEILRFDSGVYQASCSCGWYRESPGVHTKTANTEALEHHLTYEHGLAVCP